MRYALLAIAAVLAVTLAAPASAHVVQATTSVSLTDDAQDAPGLERALRSAVANVLSDAIAFTPALVALTDAQVIDGRLYVRLLIADEDGMRTLEVLEGSAREGVESRPPLLPTTKTGRTEL